MSEHYDGKSIAVGLLIGIAVGVAVGYLTAPRSGSEIRNFISEKAGDIKDKIQHVFSRGNGIEAEQEV